MTEASKLSDPVSLAATEATNRIAGLIPDIAPSLRDEPDRISAALAGVGIGMVQVHVGREEAARMAASLGDLLQADGARQ